MRPEGTGAEGVGPARDPRTRVALSLGLADGPGPGSGPGDALPIALTERSQKATLGHDTPILRVAEFLLPHLEDCFP